ncbi:MAG: creatininase family protein [Methanomassiliicoccus sp.]|nr:creatininase family protein [Methanomassiliicoccus sp.]
MRLDSLSSTEFAKVMKKRPVIFLPIGATEAHSSHLPLSTDSLQPEYIADAVAERVHGLVAPPLRYAFHSSTRNMPGTIGLGFDTTIHVVRDILDSLIANGADKLVVISGHAGSSHMNALRQACVEIVEEHHVKIMLLTDYDIAKHFPEDQRGDGHGGKVETSRVMAIAPALVSPQDKIGQYVSQGYMIVSDPERSMPDGFVGDAPSASAELGTRVNAFIIDELTREIEKEFGVRA